MDDPTGGPAFPVRRATSHDDPGMTLLDWFAGQALKWAGHGEWFSQDPEEAAKRAYVMADAMLAEKMNRNARAAPAPWQPPPEADRPDGYPCLALVEIAWDKDFDEWLIKIGDRSFGAFRTQPTAFAPLPEEGR